MAILSNIKNILIGLFAALSAVFLWRSNTNKQKANNAEKKADEVTAVNHANAEAVEKDRAARRELKNTQREIDKIVPEQPAVEPERRSFQFGEFDK